jgi:hypothetical protein
MIAGLAPSTANMIAAVPVPAARLVAVAEADNASAVVPVAAWRLDPTPLVENTIAAVPDPWAIVPPGAAPATANVIALEPAARA